MEYQQKKEEILSGVEFQNLLSFNLVENKLERNFRSIVDALLLNEANTASLRGDHQQLKNGHSAELKDLKDRLAELHREFESNHLRSKKQIDCSSQKEEQAGQKELTEQIDQPKQIEQIEFTEKHSEKKMESSSPKSLLDQRELQRLWEQIDKIKRNMPSGDYLEGMLKQAQKDISGIKGELATISQHSHKSSMKSLKRASISKDIQLDKSIFQGNRPSSKQESLKSMSNKENENKEFVANNKESESKEITGNGIDADLMDRIEKEFNTIHIELNTFKLGYQEIREAFSDLKKRQIKHNNSINDLNDLTKKMERQSISDGENFEKQLKSLQLQILNINCSPEPPREHSTPQSKPKGDNENINFKNQFNDKFSKLQAMIQACISESQFDRFKNQTRDKFESVDKNIEQVKENLDEEIKKIYELMDALKNQDICQIRKEIEELNEALGDKSSQWERKHNIALSKVQEVKKSLQNLREDVEFYQSMHAQTSENKQPQQNNEEEKQVKGKGLDPKELQHLKKSLNGKIQDQRIYLLGLIRELERKLTPKGSMEQDIVGIWDRISELNLFMNKKADTEDTKKSMAYLQKKLGAIASHLVKSEEGNEDARIARTNWCCLSCDKNLQSYSGKVGKHVVWDYMPSKTQGKFMKDEKKPLPTINKR